MELTETLRVNREIFMDTMAEIENNDILSKSVNESINNSLVFYENDYPRFDRPNKATVAYTVPGRTFEFAKVKSTESKKIAVLNFANAFHPGGGVTEGCTAQEESLCRLSTLYPVISSVELGGFYSYHKTNRNEKASDALIYSPGIVVFKNDVIDIKSEMQPVEEWFNVDVITMAAPDLRQTYMETYELYAYHVKRAIHMLTCAAHMGADILILGAIGCGAFRNDPFTVAEAYNDAISMFPPVFDEIYFVIPNDGCSLSNYSVFSNFFPVGGKYYET